MSVTEFRPNSDFSSGWTFADIWEFHAMRFPASVAQEQGERQFTWEQTNARANGIANLLLSNGALRHDKVAQYMHNCVEYMESMFALFKASLVPVNTNYRYTDNELEYLWENSDAVAVIFHATYTERCEVLRTKCPNIKTWIWVDDGTLPCPEWAVDYEVAAAGYPNNVAAPWPRCGDDMYFLYTGGTTGMPKAVMWRVDDMLHALDQPSRVKFPDKVDIDFLSSRVAKPGPKNLPGAPLMHGTAAFNAMWAWTLGGSVVTLVGRQFDPIEFLDTIEHRRANSITIVGDAFGRPILDALDREPKRWDLTSLKFVFSSGVMWSAENKAGILRHCPHVTIIDSLGSSEAVGMASSTTSAESSTDTAHFKLGTNTKVLKEDGTEVAPGSGERGRVAIKGYTPIGYYKDEAKSASTFVTIDGVRFSIPGDWAEVESDGTVKLLGRGSQCINTGGEKVYPEEVEEALKRHPGVEDAAVVGIPHERFGESVVALVQPRAGSAPAAEDLISHTRETLATYKAPRSVVFVDSVNRAPNGKLDYRALKDVALSRLS